MSESSGYMQPGYGMVIGDRLYYLIGQNVTVYFEEGTPINGMLHAVGRDYLEIHRMRDNRREMVLIPLRAVHAVTGVTTGSHFEAGRP